MKKSNQNLPVDALTPAFPEHVSVAHAFDQIRRYAVMRLALFLAKRHQRGRAWGFARLYCSGDDLGLISLNAIVVAPRPHRAWREKSNTAGEGRR